MSKFRRVWLLRVVTIISSLTGCATSQPAQFFTLSAPTPAALSDARADIVIGPITLPALVDRPQFVITRGNHEVLILEQQRWAVPLKHEIPRVIAERIETALGRRVVVYPESPPVAPQVNVTLNVTRFEGRPGENVTVEASWYIRPVKSELIRSGTLRESEPIAGDAYALLAGAYARALARVGDAVAASIAPLIK